LVLESHNRAAACQSHGFGVNAFQANVPPHLVRRGFGHASLRTTAIYGDVIGPEERAFAQRMWTTQAQ
jgi:integrase/recombinase XerD